MRDRAGAGPRGASRRARQDRTSRAPAPDIHQPEPPAASPGSGSRRAVLPFLLAPALLYACLWPLIDAGFLAHRFAAPFLTGAAFYRRYSGYAGGPIEYLANLFTQAYSRQWAGVLAFMLLALACWAIARGLLRRFSAGPCNWMAAAFPCMVLILATGSIGVLYILPMVAGLAAAWLYLAFRERPYRRWAQAAVVVLFLAASLPLYRLLASGFLYLCVMCALFELLVRKRPALGLAWIAIAAAAPFGSSYFDYEPDIQARYLRWIRMPLYGAATNGLLVAMYLFVPAGAVAAFVAARLEPGRRLAHRWRRVPQAAGAVALAVLLSMLVSVHLDRSGWLYAAYLLNDGRPDQALISLAQAPDDSDPVRFLTFYALARAGRLPWEMFHYPQLPSSDALLFRDTKWDTVPGVSEWRSDVYLELGRVNESQRWAHEALAVQGETPRVLERMALVYILNDNPDAARPFVRALESVPFQAQRAQDYLEALDRDPGLQSDALVARIRPLMLRQDYMGAWSTEQILQQCLEANPSNRMAFEYLLAHYLLTSDLDGFARLAPRLKDFYTELPAHVQEALLGYRNVKGELPSGVNPAAIYDQTEARFQRFIDLWMPLQNSPQETAWKALAPEFGRTYWFFFVFGRTAAGAQSGAPQ